MTFARIAAAVTFLLAFASGTVAFSQSSPDKAPGERCDLFYDPCLDDLPFGSVVAEHLIEPFLAGGHATPPGAST
ncbi:MAG TPA: hypothetical protein VHC97_13020 [Thermoanaerobaculia bacterium]|jgi:hypothetical protein|nr:hypothetical protein [Thermoanaerobaculia bacterium]